MLSVAEAMFPYCGRSSRKRLLHAKTLTHPAAESWPLRVLQQLAAKLATEGLSWSVEDSGSPWSNPPYVGEVKHRKCLPPLLFSVDHANAAITFKVLRKLARDFRQGLGAGNADADRNICVQCDFPHHTAHQFHQVVVLFVSVQVKKLLVDGITLGMCYSVAHNALHPLRHGGIKHNVTGKNRDIILLQDALHLKERRSSLDTQCFSFCRKSYDITVITREHAYWLSLQDRMKTSFHRSKKGIAVGKGDHVNLALYV